MRRWQTVRQYRPRGVRDDAEVTIDAADCRAMLEYRRHLDDVSRLMLLIAARHGDGVMTFRELKGMVLQAAAEAGTVKAAIKVLLKSTAVKERRVKSPDVRKCRKSGTEITGSNSTK
jgi:hypothetical protein